MLIRGHSRYRAGGSDRIEGEMLDILDSEGITGASFTERVRSVMEDPAHQFPNTDEGRAQMIAYLEDFDQQVMAISADYFITIPPQPLEIVRVPEYSQDSSPEVITTARRWTARAPGAFTLIRKTQRTIRGGRCRH